MRLGRGGGRARPRAAAAARAWGAAAALLLAVTGRAARVTAAGPGAPFAAAPFRQVHGNKQYSSAVTNPRGDVAVVVFHDDDDAEDNSVISNELRRLHGALLEKASPDGAVEFVAVDCSEQSNRFVCDDDAQVPVVPLLMVCRAHAGGGAGGPPCVPHHNPRSAASVGEAVLAALARAREIALAKALGYMHQEDINDFTRGVDQGERDPRVLKGGVMNIDADGFHEMVTKEDNIVPWVVKFYDGLHPSAKSTPVRRHFKLLASEFEGRVRVAAINCGNERARKEVCAQHNVKLGAEGLSLRAMRKGAWMAEEFEGRAADEGALRDFFKRVEMEAAEVQDALELTGSEVLEYVCGRKRFCAVLFVPGLLDSGAQGRYDLLRDYQEMAAAVRTESIGFLWAETGAQIELEHSLGMGEGAFPYPALAVLNIGRGHYATHAAGEPLTAQSGATFLSAIATGRAPSSISAASGSFARGLPRIRVVDEWTGEEGFIDDTDEFDLDELMNDGEL